MSVRRVSRAASKARVRAASSGRTVRDRRAGGHSASPRSCTCLSIQHNCRVRLRCHAQDDALPVVPSLTGVWPGVNWFEREAFDLFGIVFEGHPDLRRILTDYGFVGHPFRKDFPLIGNVEVRYDDSAAARDLRTGDVGRAARAGTAASSATTRATTRHKRNRLRQTREELE